MHLTQYKIPFIVSLISAAAYATLSLALTERQIFTVTVEFKPASRNVVDERTASVISYPIESGGDFIKRFEKNFYEKCGSQERGRTKRIIKTIEVGGISYIWNYRIEYDTRVAGAARNPNAILQEVRCAAQTSATDHQRLFETTINIRNDLLTDTTLAKQMSEVRSVQLLPKKFIENRTILHALVIGLMSFLVTFSIRNNHRS